MVTFCVVFVKTPQLDKQISHNVFFSALDVVLNEVENDAITIIFNFSSNKVWIKEFNAAINVAKIFDCVININGAIFRLEDSNKVPDLRRPERKNGVRNVRISFPKEVENIIGSLSGPTIMYGLKFVVSIVVGHKQKCYFCDTEIETFFQTENQIKRFSESDPNENEFTEKESKKPLVVLENENDKTLESESNSLTTECSIQVDQSSNEVGQQTASRNNFEENLK
ncbi:hypothetical protein BpHYR1_003486 [Brachionus plicatilis]|uniref:Uncharacterized protein n=1 Tax=Brachionus plicatilis TaxID=10195 RepID=A0A3M7T1A2_BRAPC|nr:hypothetical protein BpHYR1_003486 [Brachionus plicatilis]